MKIERINSPQFRSKINIVNPKYYEALIDTMSKDKNYHSIFEWYIRNDLSNNHKLNAFRTKVTQISTEEIRSCVSGFFVDSVNKIGNLVFHIYDDMKNMAKLDVLNNLLDGTNGLLIGSRNKFEHSIPMFENFEKIAKEKQIPLTIMKDFKDMWEANVAYDSLGDVFYLCIRDIQNPKKYVKNMEELKNAFHKVEISPTDTLEFL